MPGYPPLSPITGSHFAMWTQCDLRVGEGAETMAGIFAEIGGLFGFSADYRPALVDGQVANLV